MAASGKGLTRVPVFQCYHCEYCCFFRRDFEAPTVYPWEKRLLEEEAEKRGLKLEFRPIEVYGDEEGLCVVVLYRWLIRGFCPFYRLSTRECTIHYTKPLACRMFPLVLNLTEGKLIASSKCRWIEEHGNIVTRLAEKPELISNVFPNELEAAIEAFRYYSALKAVLESNGFKRVSDTSVCRELVDADELVDLQ